MATSIPSSFSFEMLSRLPANSFVLMWKEIRPDQTPLNNVYQLGVRQNIRFVLRGAPNEFALNTNMYLCGEAHLNLKQTDLNIVLTQDDVANAIQAPTSFLNAPIHFFQRSRESFNAGALPYLDNQDPERSHEYNNLRFTSARRNRNPSRASVKDLSSAFETPQNQLASQGWGGLVCNQDASSYIRGLINLNGVIQVTSFGKGLDFQIPLGLYSNFVNSHSILPIGLCSSYAVNGWQIELETTEQGDPRSGRAFSADTAFAGQNIDNPQAFMRDLRIFVPIVRVLDPSVMEAVLSLYEKQQSVSVGSVQFPLSLRINSIGYRFANFPLRSSQPDYFFRISGTDRSVRALAYWIYNKKLNRIGEWRLGFSGNDVLACSVTRLETHIGTEHIHEVVEDQNPNTQNVSNFVHINGKRSASLFSPLPYYEEGRKFDGQQEDDLHSFNNASGIYQLAVTGQPDVVARRALCYGYISMENLDRRESDYSGSFQASGKDLTNVGAIEVKMRIQRTVAPTVTVASPISECENLSFQTINDDEYEILFAYAYDSVMEVSPQGIMDVTNAVL
jgi:hypothetical protein